MKKTMLKNITKGKELYLGQSDNKEFFIIKKQLMKIKKKKNLFQLKKLPHFFLF